MLEIGRRTGARGLARGARLRALGARRAAARQDQRGARAGEGDRRRRQRPRPRGAGGAAARARRRPSVALTLEISAPRPVIAPFAFDFSQRDGVAHLAACSADSPEAAAQILVAARAAGLAGDADCAIGLGAPSPDWAAAVARGLDALTRARRRALRAPRPRGGADRSGGDPRGQADGGQREARRGAAGRLPARHRHAAAHGDPPDGARVYAPRLRRLARRRTARCG